MNRLMITTAALCAIATTGACSGDQPGTENQAAENLAPANVIGSVPAEQVDVNATGDEDPAPNADIAAAPVAAPDVKGERQPAPARKGNAAEATASKANAEEAPDTASKEESKAAAPTAPCAPEHRALGHC